MTVLSRSIRRCLAAVVCLVTVASAAQTTPDTTEQAPIRKPVAPTLSECPGMQRSVADAPFPREAAKRGIAVGVVVVVFTVTGDRTDVVGVDASDRAFSAGAVEIVRSFGCRTDEARTFSIPLTFTRK